MPFKIHQAVSPFLLVSGFTAAVTGMYMLLRSASGALIRWHRASSAVFILLGIFYVFLHGKGKLKLLGMHMPILGIAVVGLLIVVLFLVTERRKDPAGKPADRV